MVSPEGVRVEPIIDITKLALAALTARGGLKILPLAQAVILAALTLVGFAGGAAVDALLATYGRGIASLLLGLFIVATAPALPFTAQFARAVTPPAARSRAGRNRPAGAAAA